MPVLDLAEARDVDEAIERIVHAPSAAVGMEAARALFVERLDFAPATGPLSLTAQGLPASATRIAQRGGVQVVGIELPTEGRVRASELEAALRQIRQTLNGEILLVATERTRSQWHFVFPSQRSGREVLRRMVVHAGQARRTVAQQLAGVYRDVARATDLLTALEAAYDVEAVTKRFFQQYREIFERVMGLVGGFPDEEDRKLFCQLLFNRLMFIYFLQRKGWLTFNGDADYLEALWREGQKNPEEGFYETRLKCLFFLALNNPRDANWDTFRYSIENLIGRVPFLNGGLFAPTDLDKRAGVSVPDEAIRLILRDLFARFNFTITESTPYDIEVAVDPEMLGKVFEELVTGRHETGSYYTPRPIVSFMCREALKQHLLTHVDGLTRDLAAALVDDREVSGLTMQQARKILEILEMVTALDPACGSGAYLLGMLHELIELQGLLYSSALMRDPKSLYDLKLRVIANNVYGVDNDPFAINIAMLRLWLSLVIDYEGPRDPPALPNLEFKIVYGDSLLAAEPKPSQQRDLFASQAHQDALDLARLKGAFLRSAGEEKRLLVSQIREKHAALGRMLEASAPPGAVNWSVEFAEVFAEAGGFDVVLANPPYVRADAQFRHIPNEADRVRTIAEWQAYRKSLHGSQTFTTLYEKWDLYLPFLERAHQLLSNGGQMVFIIPDSFNMVKYAARSRQFFVTESRVERIDFCSDIALFSAAVNNTIVHFSKSRPSPSHEPLRVRRRGRDAEDFDAHAQVLPGVTQAGVREALFRPDFIEPDFSEERTVPLGDICYISYGLRANSDERYWRGEFVTDDVVSDVPDAEHPKPFVEGKDLERWGFRGAKYLEWGTARAPSKFARPTFPELYEVPEKLMALVVTAAGAPVAYDNQQRFTTHTSCVFVPWHQLSGVRNRSIRKTARYADELTRQAAATTREALEQLSRQFDIRYLLAVMNSGYARRWVDARRRSRIHVYPDDWKGLPIPYASEGEQRAISGLVSQILEVAAGSDSEILTEPARHLPPELETAIEGRIQGLLERNREGSGVPGLAP